MMRPNVFLHRAVGPVVLAVTYTLMLAWIEDAVGKDAADVSDAA